MSCQYASDVGHPSDGRRVGAPAPDFCNERVSVVHGHHVSKESLGSSGFLGFDIIGNIAWGAGLTLLGYFLGNVPFVKNHLELMILLVVFLSIVPALVPVARGLLQRRRTPREPMPEQSG